ncbi:hypothetical protein ACH4RG_25400 [Streptomyces sp. NPDC021019]|uniref:hypothetical protein n=1 Tax=Streptomyces sp. NPDC021019 TaxID=3365108 RepID=UPI00379AE2A2
MDLLTGIHRRHRPGRRDLRAPGYQVPFAEQVRRTAGVPTSAVALILDAGEAEEIVAAGRADAVVIGREMLRDPHRAHHAAEALAAGPRRPDQYGYALARRPARVCPPTGPPGRPGHPRCAPLPAPGILRLRLAEAAYAQYRADMTSFARRLARVEASLTPAPGILPLREWAGGPGPGNPTKGGAGPRRAGVPAPVIPNGPSSSVC